MSACILTANPKSKLILELGGLPPFSKQAIILSTLCAHNAML